MEDQENVPKVEKTAKPVKAKKKLSKQKILTIVVVILAAIALLTGGLYYMQITDAQQQAEQQQAQVDELEDKIATLEKSIEDAKKTEAAESAAQAAKDAKAAAAAALAKKLSTLTQDQINNITDSIKSMNTVALEGYLADSVNVVFAASEKAGPRTPAQAIADLAYLSSATSPWSFALPAATTDAWKTGDYKTYLKDATIFGKSANGYVVAMKTNASAKIDLIFVSASADLL